MLRNVRPELLDALAAHDPRALHSRGDLRRVNALMGHADVLARVLLGRPRNRPLETLIELGAGDGTLLLAIARRIAPRWPGIRAVPCVPLRDVLNGAVLEEDWRSIDRTDTTGRAAPWPNSWVCTLWSSRERTCSP
jgi:hypothetical protein